MPPVYVTGNENKARLFTQMLGMEIAHVAADIDEIQSLDIRVVVEHKVKAAYEKLQQPVIVEDTKLSFAAMGSLPGPLVKWFLEELDVEGLCRLLDGKNRAAIAGSAIAYYDGTVLEIFERELLGSIADHPRGSSGFGWNQIFIPEGEKITLAEMNEAQFKKWYLQIKPFDELRNFLDKK